MVYPDETAKWMRVTVILDDGLCIGIDFPRSSTTSLRIGIGVPRSPTAQMEQAHPLLTGSPDEPILGITQERANDSAPVAQLPTGSDRVVALARRLLEDRGQEEFGSDNLAGLLVADGRGLSTGRGSISAAITRRWIEKVGTLRYRLTAAGLAAAGDWPMDTATISPMTEAANKEVRANAVEVAAPREEIVPAPADEHPDPIPSEPDHEGSEPGADT